MTFFFQANQLGRAYPEPEASVRTTCGLLEGRRRDEAAGLQRRLGDTRRIVLPCVRTSAFDSAFAQAWSNSCLSDMVRTFDRVVFNRCLGLPLLHI